MYSTFGRLLLFLAGSRRAAGEARICEIGLV